MIRTLEYLDLFRGFVDQQHRQRNPQGYSLGGADIDTSRKVTALPGIGYNWDIALFRSVVNVLGAQIDAFAAFITFFRVNVRWHNFLLNRASIEWFSDYFSG